MATKTKLPTSAAPTRHHIDRRADRIVGADVGADDELLTTQAVAIWLGLSCQFLEIGRADQTPDRISEKTAARRSF